MKAWQELSRPMPDERSLVQNNLSLSVAPVAATTLPKAS